MVGGVTGSGRGRWRRVRDLTMVGNDDAASLGITR
jgi:hypothetical protein